MREYHVRICEQPRGRFPGLTRLVVHCKSENQSHYVLEGIRRRLGECKLRLSEEKTKITYCQDYRREKRKDYPKKFDFLGHTFKPMSKKSNRDTGVSWALIAK